MESMSVKPAQVTELASQIRSGASGIQSQLDELDSEVSKLKAQWSGAAQDAYNTAHAQWTQSLQSMNELLQRIASATDEISQGYVTSDNSSAGRFDI